jgi:putative FmdB family regulatory protein
MPIYEYQCKKCNQVNEFLVLGSDQQLICTKCGGNELVKLMSAHSTLAVSHDREVPLPSGCCGSPSSCGMPGSCCSKY